MKKIDHTTSIQSTKEILKEYSSWLKGHKFLQKAILHYVSHMFGIQEYYYETTGKDFFAIKNVKKIKEEADLLPMEYKSGKYLLALKYYMKFMEEKGNAV